MSLYQDEGRRVFGLFIQGCFNRYYYGASPFPSSIQQERDLTFTDYDYIVNVSDYTAEIEPSGGIANYSPISITLATDVRNTIQDDPHVIFGRTARSKSVWAGQLVSNISRNDSTPSIFVDNEPRLASGTAITTPHMFYIGAESFYVTDILPREDLGTGVYELVTAERYGFRQEHTILLDGVDTPKVTSEIVGWRGRQADVWAAYLNTDGTVTDHRIIFRGMIERSPEFGDSSSVSLSIVPIIAMLDNKIAGKGTINRFSRGGHYFDNTKKVFYFTPLLTYDPNGDGERTFYNGSKGFVLNQSAGYITNQQIVERINEYGELGGDTNAGFAYGNYPKFNLVYNNGYYRLRIGNLTGTIDGYTNAKYYIRGLTFHPHWKLEKAIAALYNFGTGFGIESPRHTMLTAMDFSPDYPNYLGTIDTQDEIYTGFDFSEGAEVLLTKDFSEEPYPEGTFTLSAYEQKSSSVSGIYTNYNVKGIAEAYYLQGEDYILLEQTMDLPDTLGNYSYSIQIKRGDEIYHIKATHEESDDFGYRVYLDKTDPQTAKLPSLYEYVDDERWEFTKGLAISQTTTSDVMLQILMSGGGEGINGGYDINAIGCNLPSEYIDTRGIENLSTASNINQWEFNIPTDDLTVRDVIEPMLKAMGCAMVMKRKRGATFDLPKISIIPIGHENELDVDSYVTDDDILADPIPSWNNYEDIVTQFTFKYNHQKASPDEVIFNNYDAINRLAGETAKMDLELYGLTTSIIGGTRRTEIYPFLRPTIGRLFRLYGEPIRVWNFSVGSGKALDLDIGGAISVTSAFLKGYEDSYGISGEVGMIRKLTIRLVEEGADLEIAHFGLSSPTWNAALKVTSVVSTTVLEVAEDVYSDDDISYFAVGDTVTIYSLSNNDLKGNLTIQAISGRNITFTTVHGATSTNYAIVPQNYDTAVTNHKARAYIGDLNNYLGTSNVEGYKYE
jgi:hypothetical protein